MSVLFFYDLLFLPFSVPRRLLGWGVDCYDRLSSEDGAIEDGWVDPHDTAEWSRSGPKSSHESEEEPRSKKSKRKRKKRRKKSMNPCHGSDTQDYACMRTAFGMFVDELRANKKIQKEMTDLEKERKRKLKHHVERMKRNRIHKIVKLKNHAECNILGRIMKKQSSPKLERRHR